MAALVELNGFVQADNGVFHVPQLSKEFSYSDGADTERALDKVLRNAQDLSSESPELQAHIHDWPSEYHLSATRANLLRALNLDGVSRVLELGCGCGSITRYLGEQTGLQVDAIEGSPSRAALAALRCRDLSNVTISTANFNDVQLPQGHYDLVLYVGVTEYAGRFASCESDQAALQALLVMAKNACNDNGVTLVAIENRLGLKYMLGAKEDHYAVPFVGLDDYPESTGIRTYSKHEWQHQIQQAGFSNQKVLYPFPDYKIPTLIVANAAIKSDGTESDAVDTPFYKALGQFNSRDYNSDFTCQNEGKIWQALHQAGTFEQHANSFLLLMGDSADALKRMSDFTYKSYDVPCFDYLQPALEQLSPAESNANTANVSSDEIISLQNQMTIVTKELTTLKGSRGWRWLNHLRRILGKKTL